ncbi:asparagine synthase-related protein [Paramagnetospirillum magneticum]|uniref:asparagine synthase (glutamine-hydrolyzing) n=1 Tax=Paramagnetospirillum magneticum (strain ATCC 700264 / AMB-1) TaxID=342108 RepID=Q2W7A9_PARM1|nr:asparagine synthase-related protein [Paramagnetospirillum magneticum]BAE50266.1 Asparagine synthase [Paramagnetospirillum magneticum AMB-1]
MGDFAGMWRLDGRPVDEADLTRMAQGLDGRNVAPARIWRSGPVALVHRRPARPFTPGEARELQPLTGASGAVLVADSHPGALPILTALERRGVDGVLEGLCGSFAFAVWQPSERRLTLARDGAGFRTLFLHRSERLIAFSTRLRALLSLPDIPLDLDEHALAASLILDQSQPERTIYRAIDRVPMGHVAVLTAQGTRVSRWWSLPRPGTLRHRNDSEVEEHARQVLDTVMDDALQAEGPVTSCLTGGLDSSTIVTTALRRLGPRRLLAVTRVPDGPTPGDTACNYHDESPRASAMAALHPGIDWYPISGDGGDWGESDARRWHLEGGQPTGASVNIAWFFPVYRFMEGQGSRVLLGGEQGNGYFSYSGLSLLPELFLGLRWGRLAGHLLALARNEGRSAAYFFKREVLRPFEPLSWRMRRLGRGPSPWSSHSALNPAFTREIRLDQSLDTGRYRQRVDGGHHSTFEARRWLLCDETARDVRGVLRAMTGMDLRIPLADRRVLEFFGSLPLDQFLRNGVTRSLARRLLAGQVPAETVGNRTAGTQNGDWFTRLSAARPAMIADLARLRSSPLARRVIDLDRIQGLLDHWPRDAAAAEPRRREYFHLLTRGLDMAGFLAWRESANN